MTIDDYREKLQELEETYNAGRKSLMRQYAVEANKVSVGDIVTDSRDIPLRVGFIKWTSVLGSDVPSCCVYFGVQLTKDYKPRKKQDSEFSIKAVDITSHIKDIE